MNSKVQVDVPVTVLVVWIIGHDDWEDSGDGLVRDISARLEYR